MKDAILDVRDGMTLRAAALARGVNHSTLYKRVKKDTRKRARPADDEEEDDWENEDEDENDDLAPDMVKFIAEFGVGEFKPDHPSDIYRNLGWKDEASFAPRPFGPELEAAMTALAPPRSIGVASNVTLTKDMLCRVEGCDFAHEDAVMLAGHRKAAHPSRAPPRPQCISCLKEDLRCSHELPCSQCSRRGTQCVYRPSVPASTSCTRCEQMNRHCDRLNPCSSCIKESGFCIYSPQSSTQGLAPQEPASRPLSFQDYDPTTKSWDRLSRDKR
jgi:hypothetical protein